MAEKIQCFSGGNKCWVLMQEGRIIGNSKQKYEGVPVRKGKSVVEQVRDEVQAKKEVEQEIAQEVEQEEISTEPEQEYEEAEGVVEQENDSASATFFSFS